MKILIHSNGPTIPTGYGVQTRYLATLLAAHGHEVAVSCTYGHQGPVSSWTSPLGDTVRLYPAGYVTNGADVLAAHAEHWFDGDKSAGWIITLLDVWVFQHHPTLHEYQVIAWTPVDHLPTPSDVLGFFANTGAIPLGMSKFAEQMLTQGGLDPAYIPLTVDTNDYKPTFEVTIGDDTVSARQLFNLPHDAFVVGMVAMNKGWSRDRKGFNEALRAFGRFWQNHQNAVLFMHTDPRGLAEGIDLRELAVHAAVPDHALVFTDEYALRVGLPPEMMAAAYTAMDVLLAPSHGEGFCVPLIEAQACGTPVIVSNFSAQPELVGAGWTVHGQLEWDPPQHSSYIVPFVHDIIDKLEEAYASDLDGMQEQAIEFAAQYDTRKVFDEMWVPFLDSLKPIAPVERPKLDRVDVIVPLMRPDNLDRLMRSLTTTSGDEVHPIIVHDGLGEQVAGYPAITVDTRTDTTGYAQKVNLALEHSDADFVLVVGDDVEFTDGWYEAAREASPFADVIGTNDSEEGRVRNPDVAAGRHADHFLIRRSYIDDDGASLDGPGVIMPDAYTHWFVDREVIELAKARGVFVMAPECRIIHHHPGYDGDEAAREADPVYMAAVDSSDDDAKIWLKRAPLIEGHRITRVKP
jgi:glycosyltransferase involved in cell wall biosynthesis